MGLDEELDRIEDGALTDAEEADEETELLDVEEYQDDEELDPNADEGDLEEAYEGFFAEEGPDGEGEVSTSGEDGGLATAVEQQTGIDLSEEGFHIVDGEEGDVEAELGEEGTIDGSDAEDFDDEGGVTVIEPSDDEEGYEIVEMELSDDDIAGYIEDEDGNEIGFILLEDGEEVEYYYVEDEDGAGGDAAGDEDDPYDLGITKEGVAAATNDMNAIYHDGVAVAAELKDAFDDIKSALDFSFLKKK